MGRAFRRIINDYFRFSKKDRRGVLLLSSLIVLVILATIVVDKMQLKPENDFSEFKKAIEEWERKPGISEKQRSLFPFNPNAISEEEIDSLMLPRFVKNNIINYRKAGGSFKKPSDVRKIYGMNDSIYAAIEKYISISQPKRRKFSHNKEVKQPVPAPKSFTGSFDPNTADSATLGKFGFNTFQASNVIKYRESGGSFSSPEELLKIYGVDSIFYKAIRKNIQIKTAGETEPHQTEEKIDKPKIRIELNTADTLDLLKLPGIGNVFASRIIKYRHLLGGFHNTEQLLEVYNFPEETYQRIKDDIFVDSGKIQQIRLNFAGYGELIRHPYIDKADVEAILEHRNANGAFDSLEELEKSGIVDAEKVREIKPYLSCR